MTTPHHTANPHLLDLSELDLLGRVPVPLRRAFAAGLDRTATRYREHTGVTLKRHLLTGAEWYRPFDRLAQLSTVPRMLITTLQQDVLVPKLLEQYRPARVRQELEAPALLREARLFDPEGVFRVFGIVPFVWLVDEKRLQGRPSPQTWSDLLHPMWAGEVVFGGWRASEREPYTEYNSYLLDCIQEEFGDDGLCAFAPNVRHLQHNVRTATLTGSNSERVGAISVLPWMQAELCPRRTRTRVVWPRDGAWVMPMAYLVRESATAALQPVIDYLTGPELSATLARNCYPSATAHGLAQARLPEHARLKWPGWAFFRDPQRARASQRTATLFFDAWARAALQERSCG